MINIDFLTLKAFIHENIDFLIGARVQKIQQSNRRDLILSLRNHSESRKLYINISPAIYHIAFMNDVNEKKRNLIIPKQPPMFCMQLRKYLDGCRVSDACVIDNERILELHFETCDEFAQRRSLCLCIELMGKHSNIILYDRESKIIIGCAHNIGAEKSRYRELKGGSKYIYPPKNDLKLPNELEVQFKGLSSEQIQYYLNAESYRPALFQDKYTLFSELLNNSIPQESVNAMLDNYYSNFQENLLISSIKKNLLSIATPKLKRVENSIKKIEITLEERDNTEQYKLYGDLLTANLYKKADFKKGITLTNYMNNTEVLIPLDETKTMSQNAQKYFRLYNKFKNTKIKSMEILNELKIERDYMENIIYSINVSVNTEELKEIESELGMSEIKPQKISESKLMKLDINGFEVYVGKNNKQNDYIVSKLSKDNDYWFHTKLCAGSHVLLKTENIEPDEKTIFECAKLARQYSSSKMPSKVSVIYTKRKFLKKPPTAPLGYVTYRNEKEILI